jgi:signal peptide peptidase SppA
MWPFTRPIVVPVLRLAGPIGMVSPLRPGLSIGALAGPIEKAFEMSKAPSVAVVINSPGGSAAQSHLIYKRIRQLADEKKKRVYVFCEDVAASGGYFIAAAGDEIHADPASLIGSIGVISSTFGLDKVLKRLEIDYRVHTAGSSKNILDPFLPEKPEDVERLKAIQSDIHDVFIGVVKERRAAKLKGLDQELFSGAFWAGAKALELGLIDGMSDVRTRMREIHGPQIKLRAVAMDRGGLLSRFRRLPGVGAADRSETGLALAEDLVSAAERRALWSRYGI